MATEMRHITASGATGLNRHIPAGGEGFDRSLTGVKPLLKRTVKRHMGW